MELKRCTVDLVRMDMSPYMECGVAPITFAEDQAALQRPIIDSMEFATAGIGAQPVESYQSILMLDLSTIQI